MALLLGSVVGFFVSANGPAATARLAAVVAASTTYFAMPGLVSSGLRVRRASLALVAACAAGSLLILALINGQLPEGQVTRALRPVLGLFSLFPRINGDVLEIHSRFPVHQYGLAYLLLVMIPFLAAEVLFGRGWRRQAAGLAVAILSLLLVATEARGAFLALAMSLALIGSLRSRWFWGLLPCGALTLYLLLDRGVLSRSIESDWLATRVAIWTHSLNLLSDFPFTGAGLGMPTFAQVFAWTSGRPDPYQVIHSHNVFIQAYAEQGLLGLVGLLIVIGGSLALAWRGVRSASAATRPAMAGVFGALAGTALYGLTDQVPTTNYGLMIVAVLAGLAVAAGQPGASSEAVVESNRARRDGLLPRLVPIGVGLVVVGLLLGVAPRWASGFALNAGSALVTQVMLGQPQEVAGRGVRLEQAETALLLATRWNPSNAPAFRGLARVRLLRHDLRGAEWALDQARQIPRLSDYERAQLGRLYLEMGYWQQAFDLWREAGQNSLLRQAADDLTARRDYRGSAAAHAALAELEPGEAEHLSNLAKAILAADGTIGVDEALLWFERAAELNPDARRSLSRQLVLQGEDCRTSERRGRGRLDQCIFWFGLASRVDPSFDKPEVELGAAKYYASRNLATSGREADANRLLAESIEHFRAAAEREPNNSSTWHQLGQTLETADRLPEAVAAYERAVHEAPNRGVLHVSLGRIYSRTGRCDEAQRAFAEALTVEPGNEQARLELDASGECR